MNRLSLTDSLLYYRSCNTWVESFYNVEKLKAFPLVSPKIHVKNNNFPSLSYYLILIDSVLRFKNLLLIKIRNILKRTMKIMIVKTFVNITQLRETGSTNAVKTKRVKAKNKGC